jgi:hypothetical protein
MYISSACGVKYIIPGFLLRAACLPEFPPPVLPCPHAPPRRDIRRLLTRARKVADMARPVSPTGAAFAEMVDELMALIGELREELAEERKRGFYGKVRR